MGPSGPISPRPRARATAPVGLAAPARISSSLRVLPMHPCPLPGATVPRRRRTRSIQLTVLP
jgi:hypothetical protein